MLQTILVIVVVFAGFKWADGQCTWPAPFISSTWKDNARGNLVFGTTTMSGWRFTKDQQVINQWQCTNVDSFYTDGIIMMRSVNTFSQFVTTYYYAYLCLKMVPITSASYRYYVLEPQQAEINWDRYLVVMNGNKNTSSQICYPSYGASGREYNVMIKSGEESSAAITCPWIFLGKFDYTHTSASGSVSCTSGGNTWSTCTDHTKMAFDYTKCPVDVAYSGKTTVTCVDTVPVGTENYVTVYNSGSFNGSTTYQFSCFAINDNLTTTSVAPKYCRQGQTSSDYPISTSTFDPSASQIGAVLSITTVKEHCYTCPAPGTPISGTVSVETNGTVTKAYYTCNSGYALSGNKERLCQANNTWTGSAPSCIICPSLGKLTNGNISLSAEGSTTVARFVCYVGYTLSGARNATCLVNSSWSSAKPTCVACGTLSNPTLGKRTLQTDGFSTTAVFTCIRGYKVKGVNTLSCLTNGSWSDIPPTCICDNPPAPSSGNVSVDSSGLTATYTCQVGYTLDGLTSRTCQMNGSSWSGTVPECAKITEVFERSYWDIIGGVIGGFIGFVLITAFVVWMVWRYRKGKLSMRLCDSIYTSFQRDQQYLEKDMDGTAQAIGTKGD